MFETVTVTPTRSEKPLGDVPASVNIIEKETIRQSPAVVADDVLRQVPTFSLFRRTSSLSSHPTAQGVSLRGIGPSGVSRTLVLLDGVPFNDPFGGWVYWTRVPLESADRIEVVDGIELQPLRQLRDGRRHQHRHHAGGAPHGGVQDRSTATATARSWTSSPATSGASWAWRSTAARSRPTASRSSRRASAAPIDNKADGRLQQRQRQARLQPDRSREALFFRAGYFSEDRDNGKIGEVNDTSWKSVSGGVRVRLPDESDLQARVFSDFETFHSNFLAVPRRRTPPRSIGRLTLDQTVPTDGVGGDGAVVEARSAGSNFFSAGADWRWVDGDSQEDAYIAAPGAPSCRRRSVDLAAARAPAARSEPRASSCRTSSRRPKLVVTLSARVDHWRNYDGHNLENSVADAALPTANNRADAARARRHRRQPARRRAVSPDRRVSACGAISAGASARRRSTSSIVSSASAPC